MKVGLIVRTIDGDWEGLYVDGELVTEGHCLDDPRDWIRLTNDYNLVEVEYKELTEDDNTEVNETGNLPARLDMFKGTYE